MARSLYVLGAAAVLCTIAAGATWYLGKLPVDWWAEAAAKERRATVDPFATPGALSALDPFIANLADEDGKRYLRATLQAEFLSRKVPPEFTSRMPHIRDLLLTLFTSKTFAEIRTPQGKALLREEIINRMNRVLRKDLVRAVYFTEFIVQ